MAKFQKCALESCICSARATDSFCSDDCKQAVTHGAQREFCQCTHAQCAASQLSDPNNVELPESIHVAPGRVTIDCNSLEHFQEQVILLNAALNRNREMLRAEIEDSRMKRPVSSHVAAAFAKAERA